MSETRLDTRELDRIAAGLKTNTRQVLESLAFEVEDSAKQLAPVDTGAMKNSIFTEVFETGNVVARIGPSVEYAPFVELGTWKMGAQPFLMPALQTVVWKFNSGATWQELFR